MSPGLAWGAVGGPLRLPWSSDLQEEDVNDQEEQARVRLGAGGGIVATEEVERPWPWCRGGVVGRASGRRPRAHDVRPNPQNLTVQAVRQSMAAFASFMSATAPPPSGGPAADWGTQGDPVTSWPVGGGY